MSRHAFDFLTESPLWTQIDSDDDFRAFSDEELRDELTRYRAHVLGSPQEPSKTLSVAVSAYQARAISDGEIKRSALYFDEVMLPDPVFKATEATRERMRLPWDKGSEVPRRELLSALRHVRSLTPLVRSGRVRFIPSTHVFEAPERPPLLIPEDAFAGDVPPQLREWFDQRVHVRKVITDYEHKVRRVVGQPPDAETQSINIDFGQLGPSRTQDYMRVDHVRDDRTVIAVSAPPEDRATMERWIRQSVNKAAGDFLRAVIADADTAWNLGASFVTSCSTTAALLDRLSVRSDNEAAEAIGLDIPVAENATFAQIEELLETEPAAFEAFRFELRVVAETLAMIEDPDERRAEAKKASDRLSRGQLVEVDRKFREAQRKLKWNIPLTVMGLGAGALGFAAGSMAVLPGIAAALYGASAVLSTARDHQSYRVLPGYFLWKLRNR